MYSIIKLSIFLKILGLIHLSHVKSNSISKLERNNVLNKALWVKRNADKNLGVSVFRLNSFDFDEIGDNNNLKSDNDQPTMFFSSFNERYKRDTLDVLKENIGVRDVSTMKSIKVVDDSYKEVGLLPQTDHYNIIHNVPPHPYTYVQLNPKYVDNVSENFEKIMKPFSYKTQNFSKIINNLTEQSNYEKNIFNKTVLDKKLLPWLQKVQWSSSNNNDTEKSEKESTHVMITPTNISERELFKVIGMLTKTFKRIIKQHNDIKLIHNRLQNLNNNFMKNSEQLIEKFQHFDTKYNNVVKINEKLNEKLKNIKVQLLNLKERDETLTKHLLEFENQRKQFLLQQNLFSNIQKQILSQNEKITYKQAQIANRQTIISHRQSNIGKIFNEAHQMFATTDKIKVPKYMNIVTTSVNQNDNINATDADLVKIDLFSVKPQKQHKTLDRDILKDKDAEPIDDLIYKFYFNNTFIDDFIKNHLANIVNRPDKRELKMRKPRKGVESTVLLPVTKTVEGKLRQRRWIKKKKSRINETTTVMSIKSKIMNARNNKNDNSDPFIKMAMMFCTELGQTNNVQAFNWCVEKTLRRLKVIDKKNNANPKPSTLSTTTTTTPVPESSTETQVPNKVKDDAATLAKYFPDNDELEEKLKDYELKPDTEGNVYYDRSLHISDIDPKDVDGDGGVSDTLPAFESNPKIHLGPIDNPALDLQELKRADARRLKNKIKKIKMAKK